MRILITGANGFVGQHLVATLSCDHSVIAAVRRGDVAFPGGVETRIVRSVDSRTEWDGLLNDIDVVVHLAARVHLMRDTADDPLESYREINVEGTKNLAQCSANQGVRRLIFLSSIKVNGEFTESDAFTSKSVPSPVDPYGISKFEAEEALRLISRETGLEIVVLRPSVIYGPGVRGNIGRLRRLVQTGLPLPLGGINNRRTLLSVNNLVQWILRTIEEPSVPNGPVLVGDLAPISTSTLARSMARGMGYKGWQIRVPVKWLQCAGRLLRRRDMIQRLVDDLVLEPTVKAFPGIENSLKSTEDELEDLGRLSIGGCGAKSRMRWRGEGK